MPSTESSIRGFRTVLVVVGVLYAAMAGSALVQGVGLLRGFGVPEAVVASPVLEDFFTFFYEYMAFVGLLIVLFGLLTRGRQAQLLVAAVLGTASLVFAGRELSTSDSRFGNHLYRGEATVVFVFIDLALAAVFGALVLRGLWEGRQGALTGAGARR